MASSSTRRHKKLDPERLSRIQTVYNEASAMPATERAGFLDRTCAGDKELRSEVELLLATRLKPETSPDKAALHPTANGVAEEGTGLLGRKLGQYQVLSRVGRGGMGEVYCAVDSHLNQPSGCAKSPSAGGGA